MNKRLATYTLARVPKMGEIRRFSGVIRASAGEWARSTPIGGGDLIGNRNIPLPRLVCRRLIERLGADKDDALHARPSAGALADERVGPARIPQPTCQSIPTSKIRPTGVLNMGVGRYKTRVPCGPDGPSSATVHTGRVLRCRTNSSRTGDDEVYVTGALQDGQAARRPSPAASSSPPTGCSCAPEPRRAPPPSGSRWNRARTCARPSMISNRRWRG